MRSPKFSQLGPEHWTTVFQFPHQIDTEYHSKYQTYIQGVQLGFDCLMSKLQMENKNKF